MASTRSSSPTSAATIPAGFTSATGTFPAGTLDRRARPRTRFVAWSSSAQASFSPLSRRTNTTRNWPAGRRTTGPASSSSTAWARTSRAVDDGDLLLFQADPGRKLRQRPLVIGREPDREPKGLALDDPRGEHRAQEGRLQLGFDGVRTALVTRQAGRQVSVSSGRSRQVDGLVVDLQPQRELPDQGHRQALRPEDQSCRRALWLSREPRVGIALRRPGKKRLEDEADQRRLSLRIPGNDAQPDLGRLEQVPVEPLDVPRVGNQDPP